MLHPAELKNRVVDLVMNTDTADLPRWRTALLFTARIGFAVAGDIARGQLTLRAMSLVYTTLLSVVPLLAVSFSVLKAFGVHNQVEPALARFLAPLGPRAPEVTTRIVDFVENLRVGVLGALGLVMLIYTVIALMQKVEEAFNLVWRVRRQRGWAERFSDYLSVLLVGPVLVFSALGITGSLLGSDIVQRLAEIEPFGMLINLTATVVPYLLIITAFTFIYVFIPYTRVQVSSALVGALIAGVLWQSTGWIFASVIAASGRYTAIYSAFATLVLFMLWLYLSWMILLIGANISYYYQNPRLMTLLGEEPRLSARLRESSGLAATVLIAERQYARRPPPSTEGLAETLRLPVEVLHEVLEALVQQRFLAHAEDTGRRRYVTAVPPDALTVREVLDALRSQGEGTTPQPLRLNPPASVERVLQDLQEAIDSRLGAATITDLCRTGPETGRLTSARTRMGG